MRKEYKVLNLYLGKKEDVEPELLNYIAVLKDTTIGQWIKWQIRAGWERAGLLVKEEWDTERITELKKTAVVKLKAEAKTCKEEKKDPIKYLSSKYGISKDQLHTILKIKKKKVI